jgi:hypothetical protein
MLTPLSLHSLTLYYDSWGFRRVTQGRDRNSYYHESFLRGLPHLCKDMKRPGVAEKTAADPEHEPDFFKISELHPVPEKAEDESILLTCTLEGGPKARMPIISSALMSRPAPPVPVPPTAHLTPHDQDTIMAFQQSLGASENQLRKLSFAPMTTLPPPAYAASAHVAPASFLRNNNNHGNSNNHLVSQFAAGFCAARALSQHQLVSAIGNIQQHQQQQLQRLEREALERALGLR